MMVGQFELMHGDCLEQMNNIPDGSIDMILTDLPYGMTRNAWDTIIPFDAMWEQFYRVSKIDAAIVLHGMQPFTSKLIMSNQKDFKYCLVWDKHLVTGFLNAKKQPMRQHEDIAVFYRKQCVYNPQMTKGKMQVKNKDNSLSTNYGRYNKKSYENDTYYPKTIIDKYPKLLKKDGHPTQKPVGLLEYLIKTYTNEGDTVLDACMGSGSTGVACINTGRRFIGIEKDAVWFERSEKRINEAWEEKCGEFF